MTATINTDVLIVGAGPTGLSLAAQLLRYGIDFVICDKREGITDLSKALVVHARTLEIYDQLGLAQTAVAQGEVVQRVVLMHAGRVSARLDFGNLGGDLSPFPFALVFEQSKNERLLYDHVRRAGAEVRWGTDLVGLTQDEAGVRATLHGADGTTQTVEARSLVGCDGAGSATRRLLDLGFEGSTYPRVFYVADVEAKFEGERDSLYLAPESNTFLLLFPMQGKDHWRLVGPLPEYEEALRADPEREVHIVFEDIARTVTRAMKRPLTIRRVHWFSSYKVHTRHAAAFARGRCFLAGDAAHVHTPAGGQGMNTGIQDAYNLAWKLALALRHGANDALLDTYNLERLANARQLLRTTDRLFQVAAGDTWYQQWFRDIVLPPLAGVAFHFDAVKEALFPFISQIGIHYPDSPLSQHEGDADFKVKAGDRVPYLLVDSASLYERLRAPSFHLLCFSNDEGEFAQPRAEIERAWGSLVSTHALPLGPRVAARFGARQSFCVLLRPDLHIACIARTVTEQDVRAYFGTFGVTPAFSPR